MWSLLGARLSCTVSRVVLLDVHREHIRAINDSGLLVQELDGTEHRYHVTGYDDPCSILEPPDLVLVMVKSYATQAAITAIRNGCCPSTLFLTLQNGIGNWECIAGMVGTESVLAGVTAQGSTLVGPGCIRHGGNGPTFIGEPKGPVSSRVRSVVEIMRQAGLEVAASDCVEQLIWHKLLINVGINAITALTGIRNGLMAELEPGRELCRAAVEEAMQVARAKSIPLQEDTVERVLSVARATAVNRSSMGQDVDRRSKTEIDVINGAIVRLGEEVHIATPVNRTLTQLIKIMEAGFSHPLSS